MLNKKKLPALLLSLSLCMSTAAPVSLFAQEQVQEENSAQASEKEQVNSALQVVRYSLLDANKKSLSVLYPQETATLAITLKNTGIKTSQVIDPADLKDTDKVKEAFDISRLLDGFDGGSEWDVEILSKENEALRFTLTFHDITWKEKSDTFRFSVGYTALDDVYDTMEAAISQVKEKEEEKEETPVYETGSYGVSEAVTIASATPNLIIQKYTYGGESVEAGKEFTLNITFYNTSKNLKVENIVASLEADSGLAITNSSNTFYFDSLAAQASQKISLKMKALSSIETSTPGISVSFRYEYVDDSTRSSQSSSERISIPVSQPDRFEIEEPDTSLLDLTAGSEAVLSFNYVNKGKTSIDNVEVRVEGDVPALSSVSHIGNIESGKSGSIDVILEPDTAGEFTQTITIAYENSMGEEVELTYPLQLTIGEMPVYEDMYPSQDEEEETSSFNWIYLLLALAAVVVGVLLYLSYKKKHAKKNDVQDEQELSALFEEDEIKDQNDHEA